MNSEDRSIFYYFGLLGQIGLTFILNVLAFMFLYKYVVARYIFESQIIFILFILAGVASGFISVYRLIMK